MNTNSPVETETAVLPPQWAAALAYAARGRPVLPIYEPRAGACSCARGAECASPGKHPQWDAVLCPSGLESATTEPATIVQMAARWPTSNIGMRCDGLVVVDVDGDEGRAMWERLTAEHGDPGTLSQVSGSGGQHVLFRHPESERFLSRVRFLPGLDLRCGRSACLVVAPSVHRSGRRYRWASRSPVAPVPPWLEALLPRRAPERPAGPPQTTPPGECSPYGRHALYRELEAVRTCPEGRRNARLFLAARNLGELIAGGELSAVGVPEALGAAGLAAGLSAREVTRTIQSGLLRGMETPRRAPERGRR
jgi:hypothetical protein